MNTQIKKITEVRQILCEFFLFHLMVKYKLTRLNVVRRKLSAFGKRANVILWRYTIICSHPSYLTRKEL